MEVFMKEKVFNKIKYYLPLACSIIAILFLLGVDLTYKTEVGDSSEYFDVHLWDLFNPSLTPIWLIIVILVFISLGGLLPLMYLINKFKDTENIAIISVFSSLIAVLLLLVEKEIFSYFAESLIENYKSAEIGYGLALAIFFTLLSSLSSLLCSPKKYGDNVASICEDGVLIAMAFVLSFIKIPVGSTGGSINFQMLPLFFIALRRGPLHGLVAGGLIYGLLSCISDGYGFVTFPFDYFIAFGSVAILGLFRKIIIDENTSLLKGELFILLGGLLSTLVRFIGSTVSSMLIYEYDLVAALTYNAIYIPLSGAAAIVVVMFLYKPFLSINRHYPIKSAN